MELPQPFAFSAQTPRVGNYQLLRELALGSNFRIDLAIAPGVAKAPAVAVKRLRHDSPSGRERLLREARVGAGLRVPNLLRVVEARGFTSAEGPFVALEYVRGASLHKLLAHARPSDLRHALAVILGALHGLDALHSWSDEQGTPGYLVHQAPTARHMLVGIDGVSRLIDLSHLHGRLLGEETSTEGLVAAELAPEQVQARELDPRCDVFIAGVTLRNVLARCAPLERTKFAPLDEVWQRATAPRRSDRFWCAQELGFALQRAAAELELVSTPAELGPWVRARIASETPAPRGARIAAPRTASSLGAGASVVSTAELRTPGSAGHGAIASSRGELRATGSVGAGGLAGTRGEVRAMAPIGVRRTGSSDGGVLRTTGSRGEALSGAVASSRGALRATGAAQVLMPAISAEDEFAVCRPSLIDAPMLEPAPIPPPLPAGERCSSVWYQIEADETDDDVVRAIAAAQPLGRPKPWSVLRSLASGAGLGALVLCGFVAMGASQRDEQAPEANRGSFALPVVHAAAPTNSAPTVTSLAPASPTPAARAPSTTEPATTKRSTTAPSASASAVPFAAPVPIEAPAGMEAPAGVVRADREPQAERPRRKAGRGDTRSKAPRFSLYGVPQNPF